MLGAVRTAEGDTIATGPIILDTSHADPAFDQLSAMRHYSDTGHAVADVRIGEDHHGIWVAGALRPSTTPEQVRTLRASPLSGDWRSHQGSLELVAALAVSSPGFAIERPRALIASAGVMRSAVGIGAVAQRRSVVNDPGLFELAAMRVKVEGVRRTLSAPSADELREQRFAALDEHRRREASERSLISSMSLPSALVQDWAGPVAFEDESTGDGRRIATGALRQGGYPTLRWAPIDNGGHDGALAVGRVETLSRRPGGVIWATGTLDLGSAEGREVARQIAAGVAGGVSVDLDDPTTALARGEDGGDLAVTSDARVRGITLVQIPAFDRARIALVGPPRPGSEPDPEDDAGEPDPNDCGCEPASEAPLLTTASGDLPDLSDTARFPGLDSYPGLGESPMPTNRKDTSS
ncbi:hypothetical protein [Pseudolysinimonas kribbensis]|nr:hypothetical protein [Pseudolysinimonas kribbensis]